MADRDYVLGTQDEEIERLGLQHRVWRARMLDAFRRAGISVGHHVIDVGAGPGYASLDLAELVGPSGRVTSVERSRRFLDTLAARARRAEVSHVDTVEADILETMPEAHADFAWCRWVLCFVPEPRRALAHIVQALKPGGTAIFHEYADYGAWQMMPPNPDQERFRELVMKSWRDAGGEPDIGRFLPQWLEEEGLEIVSVKPLVDIIDRNDFTWQWPASFMAVNAERLRDLGYAEADEAARWAELLAEAPPTTRMITPIVSEIIARRRG